VPKGDDPDGPEVIAPKGDCDVEEFDTAAKEDGVIGKGAAGWKGDVAPNVAIALSVAVAGDCSNNPEVKLCPKSDDVRCKGFSTPYFLASFSNISASRPWKMQKPGN
jgi:hypothetical protein